MARAAAAVVGSLALLALASAYPYTQQTPEEPTCDASYNKPCSIDVARFVAEAAAAALESTSSASDTLDDITDGAYNGKSGYDGFYPVVYNASGRCVAHGKDASAVGLRIENVTLGGAGSPEAVQEGLLSRLIAAATSAPDNWIRFLSPEELGTCVKNEASIYCPIERVANVVGASNGTYYVLSAYTDTIAPTDSHCTNLNNGMCSVENSKVLVGDAMSQLVLAPTQADFEATMRALSYSDEFHINGFEFYVFM